MVTRCFVCRSEMDPRAAFLRGLVEQCNTQLNMGMFSEEVDAVAAVINRDNYKFK